jgi:hypothetical protein
VRRELTTTESRVLVLQNNAQDNKVLREYGRTISAAYFSSESEAQIAAAACGGNVVEVFSAASHSTTERQTQYLGGGYSAVTHTTWAWETFMAIIYALPRERVALLSKQPRSTRACAERPN